MFPLERIIEKQLRQVKGPMPTLIFPEAEDPRVVEAVSGLVQYAKVVLVAKRRRIEQLIDETSIPLKVSKKRLLQSVTFVLPEDNPDLVADFAQELQRASKGRSWEVDKDESLALVVKPTYFSILCVRLGYADAVLGGLTNSSLDFFRPCLRLLERSGTVYEMGLFALPDSHVSGIFEKNLVMFADVALNPEPSAQRLADIAVGACVTLRNILPVENLAQVNGALLSYSTRGSGQGPSVDRIREAEPLIEARLKALAEENPLYKTINIVAELQIGCAISKEAARTKLGEAADNNPAIGESNVLIVPTLDSGNLLYHIYATRYPDAKTVLIIGGLKNQALDFSRSSKTEDVIIGAKILVLRMLRSGRFKCTPKDLFFPRYKILTINPRHHMTEIVIWNGRDLGVREEVHHPLELVEKSPMEQIADRQKIVSTFLSEQHLSGADLDAVVGRCGLIYPVESGTYSVDEDMLRDLRNEVNGTHIANMGAILAKGVAGEECKNVFVVDPPVVDELDELSRISGLNGYGRKAIWHALGQKAVAKQYAVSHGREYEELNLIVAYLGSGISIGAHILGRCVKVNNALYEGPMGPERAGNLSSEDVIDICFSGLTKGQVIKHLTSESGLVSYLGTSDFEVISQRLLDGDPLATTVVNAMVDQIAAEIASLVPKFNGGVIDQLLLTGPLTRSEMLVQKITSLLTALPLKVSIFPGNEETEALRDGALRVLRGVEHARQYQSGKSKVPDSVLS